MVLLSQVNRKGCEREGGLELFDLRDSGCLEQDADGVLLVKSVEGFQNGRPAVLTCEIAKHRHGPQGGIVRFCWFQDQGRIESYNPAEISRVTR